MSLPQPLRDAIVSLEAVIADDDSQYSKSDIHSVSVDGYNVTLGLVKDSATKFEVFYRTGASKRWEQMAKSKGGTVPTSAVEIEVARLVKAQIFAPVGGSERRSRRDATGLAELASDRVDGAIDVDSANPTFVVCKGTSAPVGAEGSTCWLYNRASKTWTVYEDKRLSRVRKIHSMHPYFALLSGLFSFAGGRVRVCNIGGCSGRLRPRGGCNRSSNATGGGGGD